MSANFWTSTHFKELLDSEEVDIVHQLDKERGITLDDFKLIKLHMSNYIARLAQNVKVRQRVVATAITYMRRVYIRKSMTEYDPRLVAPACLYLASKAEESTVQARLLVFYIKKLYSDDKYRYEIKDILEMEMKILEALNYYLVIFHPYRSLSQLLQDAGMNDATQLTWGLVNDTYKMDLILIHPPHLIALACIYIASVLKDKENTAWFEELRADMNVIPLTLQVTIIFYKSIFCLWLLEMNDDSEWTSKKLTRLLCRWIGSCVVKNIAMEILDFYDSHKMITDERVNAAMSKLAGK